MFKNKEDVMTPKLTGLVLAAATVGQTIANAQPPRPTVAVTSFDGRAGVHVSQADSSSLADDLAIRLADAH